MVTVGPEHRIEIFGGHSDQVALGGIEIQAETRPPILCITTAPNRVMPQGFGDIHRHNLPRPRLSRPLTAVGSDDRKLRNRTRRKQLHRQRRVGLVGVGLSRPLSQISDQLINQYDEPV